MQSLLAPTPPRLIEVHTLDAAPRRLLLEMLVSERCGEDSLNVRDFGRDETAAGLFNLRLCRWVGAHRVVLTSHGRGVAESLAERLVRGQASSGS